ncbi:putative gustatory receptor 22f [Drosophila takahashii]|uniref:putative gustatory receptor 22f n=1 Tax=Drosophila takahashii TaxID=29030 RepID=UPI003898FA52
MLSNIVLSRCRLIVNRRKMSGTRSGYCQNLAWFMLKMALYGSWILGLFPFTFDSKRKQLRHSRWLFLYGFIGHSLLLCLLCFSKFESKEPGSLDSFQRNPMLARLHQQFGVITIFCAIFTHFMNLWGSKKVQEIANELLILEYRDFHGLNINNSPKFYSCVIQKILTMMCQSLILFTFSLFHGNGFSKIFSFLSCLPLLDLQLIVMRFQIEILFVYRYVLMINRELVDLASNIRLNPTAKSSRIRELAALYNRLLKLNKKVVKAFDLQLNLILAEYLTYNIVILYFLIVLGISQNKQSFYFVAIPQVALNLWDFWLNIVVCDITEKAGGKTLAILKLFNDLEHKDVELERSQLNEFAWLCSHRKFRFQLCGLFSINYNMGFQMIITSFLYLVYLVQFDYMNL